MIAIWLTLRYATETPRAPDRSVDLPGQSAAVVALATLAASTGSRADRRLGRTRRSSPARDRRRRARGVPADLRRAAPARCCHSGSFAAHVSATAAIGLLLNIAFYGLHLRPQPVLPARPGPLGTGDRAGVRADDRARDGDEPGRGRLARVSGTRHVIAASRRDRRGRGAALLGARRSTSYWTMVCQLTRSSAQASG